MWCAHRRSKQQQNVQIEINLITKCFLFAAKVMDIRRGMLNCANLQARQFLPIAYCRHCERRTRVPQSEILWWNVMNGMGWVMTIVTEYIYLYLSDTFFHLLDHWMLLFIFTFWCHSEFFNTFNSGPIKTIVLYYWWSKWSLYFNLTFRNLKHD